MYSLKLGTGTAAVLTDQRLIKQPIDKNSNIHSNRPPSLVSYDLITGGDHLLVMQYGNLWRSFRKLIRQYFTESMVERAHCVPERRSRPDDPRLYVLSRRAYAPSKEIQQQHYHELA
jgi:cytochrome P450